MNSLKFDDFLKVVLIIASFAQFFLSFVKGRGINKDYGDKIFTLNMGYVRRRLLASLFIGLMAYFAYIIITGYFNILGILIVVYFLISIYDFSKIKIITSTGIGQKSFYSNAYYNFTEWNNIVEWNWSKDRKNLIIFKVKKKDRIETKDWLVIDSEKKIVDELFQKHKGNI